MTEHDREKFNALRDKYAANFTDVLRCLKKMDDDHLSLDERKQQLKKKFPKFTENERTFLLFCGLDFR
ncbi:MAG: hypothetical protein OEZ40_01615 [Candidatus Bathyarchaeota archaeon]|nr:hypothetical protein [Candidatus Bathyarchaeota archaeon]